MTKILYDQNIIWPKYYMTKMLFDQNVIWPKYYMTKILYDIYCMTGYEKNTIKLTNQIAKDMSDGWHG